MNKVNGFTLIELMIVVAVIAIIAVLAMPSFLEQIRKGKRSEAVRAIGEIQLRQERWRADNPSYGSLDEVTSGSAAAYNAALNNYNITVDDTSGSGYTITATRKNDLANDPRCGNFTMTMAAGTATKGVSSGDVNYCWRQ
jgi:type IV pilus assembly protein PilE